MRMKQCTWACVYVCAHVHVSAGAHGVQKQLIPLEQTVVSYLMGVPRTEIGSCARAVYALHL